MDKWKDYDLYVILETDILTNETRIYNNQYIPSKEFAEMILSKELKDSFNKYELILLSLHPESGHNPEKKKMFPNLFNIQD